MADESGMSSGGMLTSHPWDYEEFGIRCTHAWEAIKAGLDRLMQTAKVGTDAQVEAELQQSDPLVRMFFLIQQQRGLFFLAMGHTLLTTHPILGQGDPDFLPGPDKLEELFIWLGEQVRDLLPAYEKRLRGLHKDAEDPTAPHETVPWDYPPLLVNVNATPITETDTTVSSRLLDSIFGG